MASKYVAPAKRVEMNFPELVNSKPSQNVWNKGKSFAALATEWNKSDEEEKEKQRNEEDIENNRKAREELNNRHVYIEFVRHNNETDIMYDDEVVSTANPDTWNMIDRKKAKVQLTMEEKFEKDEARELEEKLRNDESVWTCDDKLDFRDRRTCS